jgi:hypothetical protein
VAHALPAVQGPYDMQTTELTRGHAPELVAGKAWAFRYWVECDATARFARMVDRLEEIKTPAPLVAMARQASKDEWRHSGYCAELAADYGRAVIPGPIESSEIAPAKLSFRKRVIYEVVASCLAESESSVMLVTLMGASKNPKMKRILREFAKDEVMHAQLGWGVLASHKDRMNLGFLATWIPWMLQTTAGDSFRSPAPGGEDPRLADHGVLPYSLRRQVFIDALLDVIFPGLEALSIDTAPSRAWLEASVST